MPSNCPECGSSRVVEDDLYSQRQWVCEDCGSVVSEGHLTTTLSDETQGRAVPYYESTEMVKKPCRNLIAGFSRVRALCRILRLSNSMEAEAVSLYERAYNHPNFLHVTLTKKQVMGGCCILYVCRQNNWPVAMGTIGYLLGEDNYLMGAIYQELMKSLNIESSNIGITALMESFCSDFKLGPGQVEEVFSEAPQRLRDRTTALIELAADAWVVTGRQPLPLITATLYVAWQSLNPNARMKYSLVKFCKIAKAPAEIWQRSRDTVAKRLSELMEVLCKLARELPWMRNEDVTPNTVVPLLEDVLKNRRALLMRAQHQLQEELETTESTAEETDCEKQTDEGENGELPADHWGRRHVFLPPCVKSQKRRKPETPQPDVTGDEDISDTEIQSYIRSQEEINTYLKARKKLKEA